MTNEELLKPRYKVIANYPLSPYKIGDIITKPDIKESIHLLIVPNRDDFGDKLDEQHFYDISDLQLYPALFKPLKWWQERELTSLPPAIYYISLTLKERIYNNIDDGTGFIKARVYKQATNWQYKDGKLFYSDGLFDDVDMCYPATADEYENYKQSKQCNS